MFSFQIQILPRRSRATHHHYHPAFPSQAWSLLSSKFRLIQLLILFRILPRPNWLRQPANFQQTHAPLPFEERTPPEQAQLLLPPPVAFGEPLKVGWWKGTRPGWVQAVPRVVTLHTTTLVRIPTNLC